VILEALEKGEDIEAVPLSRELVESVKNRLVGAVARLTSEWNQREQQLDLARREQQRATLRATLELRVQRARERLRALEERGAGEFPIKMATATVEKARRELDGVTASTAHSTWGGLEQEEIAVGLLQTGGD
jgi:hypothetical protein